MKMLPCNGCLPSAQPDRRLRWKVKSPPAPAESPRHFLNPPAWQPRHPARLCAETGRNQGFIGFICDLKVLVSGCTQAVGAGVEVAGQNDRQARVRRARRERPSASAGVKFAPKPAQVVTAPERA